MSLRAAQGTFPNAGPHQGATRGILIGVRVLDRSLSRFPRPLRALIDWMLTITLAVVGVLVFQAEIAKPYRIPSASMEPTLHCGKPADGCGLASLIE